MSGVTSAELNGQSYVIVTSSDPSPRPSPLPLSDYMSLNISTTVVHGLILWRGQVSAAAFIL